MGKAPNDLDSEFDQFNNGRTIVRCATCKLPDEMKAWVDTKLAGGVASAAIAQFLTAKGHVISASAISNHKNAGFHVS